MIKRLLFQLIICFASCISVFSQSIDNEIFIQPSILDSSNSQKLLFRVENLNLFKNTEYFSPIAEGHTYLGYILRPSFTYQPTHNTCLQVGIHLLKYSGLNGFSQNLPYFRFQYRITPSIDLVMGNLYSTLNHRMIEPIYGFDRFLEENLENGVQFLAHTSRYRGDLWINWQKFIGYSDAQKEQFSVGHSSELRLTNTDNKLKIALPFQFLVAHMGGQNTVDTSNMITRGNAASGLIVDYHIDHSFAKNIGINGYYLAYKDVSPTKKIDYTYGNGTYANVYFKTSFINFTLGHWSGFQFFNPRGERLFSNISTVADPERLAIPISAPNEPRYKVAKRELFLSKIFIHHEISRGIQLAASFESYYDYKMSQYDLYYALYLICNMDFFIRDIKLHK